MKKSKKIKNKKNLEELKKLKLFGDSEIRDYNEDLDHISGGNQDTTVDTQWPTQTNENPDK